jgi:large repetitive protein
MKNFFSPLFLLLALGLSLVLLTGSGLAQRITGLPDGGLSAQWLSTPPVAYNDTISTAYNAAVAVRVTTNDTDADSLDVTTVDLAPATPGRQTVQMVIGQGTFSVDNTGLVTFNPSGTYVGLTTVSYTVNALNGATSNVGVLAVLTTNTPPVANNDIGNTAQEETLAIEVIANDTDAEGNATINGLTIDLDPLQVGQQTSVTIPTEGTYTVDSSGYIAYTPLAGFTAVSTISYAVQDALGATSNAATLTVNVGPMAQYDASAIVYTGTASLDVTANDYDTNGLDISTVDLDPGSPGIQTTYTVPGQGTFTVTSSGVVTFVPTGTYVGITWVNYVLFDHLTGNRALSNIATYSVSTTDVAPVAVNDSRNTTQATPTTFSVTANDNDANGNTTINLASIDLDPATPGQQTSITVAGEGTFTADHLGNVTFTPLSGFTGISVVTYTIQDEVAQVSNAANIAVNTGPLAINDVAFGIPNTPTVFNVVANDFDANGIRTNSVDLDPLTVGRQTTRTIGGRGTFTVNNSGIVTFTPLSGFTGSASLNYTLQDAANAASNVATITVHLGPLATTDAATSTFGQAVRLAAGTNDTDSEGVLLTSVDLDPATSGIQTSHLITGVGTFTVDAATGEVVFTPAATFAGGLVSSFYVVSDSLGAVSNSAQLHVTVTPYADVVTTISGTQAAATGQPVTYLVTTVNRGPSDALAVVVSVQLPPQLQNPNGTPFGVAEFTYTPATGLLVYDGLAVLPSGQTLYHSFSFLMPNQSSITSTAQSRASSQSDPDSTNNNGSQASASITTSTPLPVELIEFTATAAPHRTAQLRWATASEWHSAAFLVERSPDGRTFVEIGQVAGAGSSSIRREYEFSDTQPLAGLNYYRLRQTDQPPTTGTGRYSDIRVLKFDPATRTDASLYPNPTTTDAALDLRQLAAGNYSLVVSDLQGRQVLTIPSLAAGLRHVVPVAALPVGTYLVGLTSADGQRQTLRLIRQ